MTELVRGQTEIPDRARPEATMLSTGLSDHLLSGVICPHCWETFAPEQVLWISEHSDLLGDPLLGAEQQQRFLPSRFTVKGDALDARGMVCHSLACPRCHLTLPRSALETPILFVSILGAAASGKSYLLTTMIHELRRALPAHFGIAFSDVDPAANRVLNECEESLFFNEESDRLMPLGNLIRKTELEGELYETIALGNQTIAYPRPFLFDLRLRPEHPRFANAAALAQILCIYDNAGEHFLPGKDTTATPVTRHLAQSRALLFVLDPTQDPRFLAALGARNPGQSLPGKRRLSRQEMILHEAAARMRRYTGLAPGERHPRPLIIILTKADQWSHLLFNQDPTLQEPWCPVPGTEQAGIEVDRIEHQSQRLRKLLAVACPEIVDAAENFAQEVIYIATSALGEQTEIDPQTGLVAIRPQDVRPRWVTVPILYVLSRILPGLITKLRRKAPRVST
jgi:hypothetical protein